MKIKTKQDSEAFIKAFVKEQEPSLYKHFVRFCLPDFEFDGTETEEELREYANDFFCDCESDDRNANELSQDVYNDRNSFAIAQSERYETFRNEY